MLCRAAFLKVCFRIAEGTVAALCPLGVLAISLPLSAAVSSSLASARRACTTPCKQSTPLHNMQLSNVYASERGTRAVCCSRRLRHAVGRPVWPRSALQQQQGHMRWCRSAAAAAGAQSTSDIEAQQQQQQKAPCKPKKEGMTMRAKRSTDPKKYYDLSFFHYMPAWLQPAPILGAGAVFFLLALALGAVWLGFVVTLRLSTTGATINHCASSSSSASSTSSNAAARAAAADSNQPAAAAF